MNDMTRQRASGDHYCRTHRRRLGSSGTAKYLCRAITAPMRQRGNALFNPSREPAEATHGCMVRGHWQKRRGRSALKVAPTHFAAQLAIDLPARDASVDMGLRKPCVVVACLAGSLGSNRPVAELAHTTRRCDSCDSIQLGVRAANGRAHLAKRESQVASGRYRTYSIARHHSNDLALSRIEIGHQVGSSRKAILQLQSVERVGASRNVLNSRVELDPHARSETREVPPFAMATATMIDREPEGAKQVLFIGDAAWRHDDSRDRVVHDLFLSARRDAASLAAAPQLSDQLGATLVQLRRRLLGGPSFCPMPRGADHAHAPPPAPTHDPTWYACSCKQLIHKIAELEPLRATRFYSDYANSGAISYRDPRRGPLLAIPVDACENEGMTKTELHELVERLPENTIDGAAVLLRGLSDGRIDPDQAWFWTSDWLSGELEADREAATDPGAVYEDADAFKAALQAVRAG
jgi:hypothetical protein